jgi:hypothetical protein
MVEFGRWVKRGEGRGNDDDEGHSSGFFFFFPSSSTLMDLDTCEIRTMWISLPPFLSCIAGVLSKKNWKRGYGDQNDDCTPNFSGFAFFSWKIIFISKK